MRNITAGELIILSEYYKKSGNEKLGKMYEEEEQDLQNEMNQD